MSIQSVLMSVEFEDNSPIALPGEQSMHQLIKNAALEFGIEQNNITLYLKQGDRWMKVSNQKAYHLLVTQAAKKGQDLIELKIEQLQVLSRSDSLVSTELSGLDSPRPSQRVSHGQIKYRILPDQEIKRKFLPSLDLTLDELNQIMRLEENISQEYICAFYNEKGAPLTGSLGQMIYTKANSVMKYDQTINILVVQNFDHKTLTPLNPHEGEDEVLLLNQRDPNQWHTIKINLNTTTLREVKQKIYSLINVPTFELELKKRIKKANSSHEFQQVPMISDNKRLIQLDFTTDHHILWTIKQNLYQQRTFKESICLNCPQSEKGRRILHSMLYLLSQKGRTLDFQFKQFLGIIRAASSNNAPLVHSLIQLCHNQRMSLLDSLALQQGFCLLCDYILRSVLKKNQKDIPNQNLLQYCLEVVALLMHICQNNNLQVGREQNYNTQNILCPLSFNVMEEPVKVMRTDGTSGYYDKISLISKLQRGETLPGLQHLKIRSLQTDQNMKLRFNSCKLNQKNQSYEWTGKYFHLDIMTLFTQTFRTGLSWMQVLNFKKQFQLTKIIPPLSLKQQNFKYHLTQDKQRQIAINIGITPKAGPNDVDLLNIIKNQTTTIDIQQLGSALQNTNKEQSKDSKFKITRKPLEAIVVCFDKSSSMAGKFCRDREFDKISATKQFFQSFADRTVGYSYHHVISLLLFDSYLTQACKFTQNIQTFCHKIEQSTTGGNTALWDALDKAVDQLVGFSRKYPDCRLRIFCLSDGESNCGKKDSLNVSVRIHKYGIILDSVVVGEMSQRLKAISFASGGFVYLPQSIKQGIKLFQSETLLSIRNRLKPLKLNIIDQKILRQYQIKPYQTQLPPIQRPEQIQKPQQPAINIINRVAICPPSFSAIASGIRYKRIMRQLHKINQNPHVDIKILPSQEDVTFWNIYMKGPSHTPYEDGTFQLYIQFTQNYPKEPPSIRFVTPIYHCNVNSTGRICHSVLDQFYTADTTIRHILNCVFGLLMSPQPLDPLDTNIASEYLHDFDLYQSKATDFTHRHASYNFPDVFDEQNLQSIPQQFADPFTGKLIENPVICIKTGKSYEKDSIERIIRQNGRDPETGMEIRFEDLIPNIALKKTIDEYKRNKELPWYNNQQIGVDENLVK